MDYESKSKINSVEYCKLKESSAFYSKNEKARSKNNSSRKNNDWRKGNSNNNDQSRIRFHNTSDKKNGKSKSSIKCFNCKKFVHKAYRCQFKKSEVPLLKIQCPN